MTSCRHHQRGPIPSVEAAGDASRAGVAEAVCLGPPSELGCWGGAGCLLRAHPTETIIRSGYASEGLTFRFNMADVPIGAIIIVADDDGTGVGVIDECDETNNELILRDLCVEE